LIPISKSKPLLQELTILEGEVKQRTPLQAAGYSFKNKLFLFTNLLKLI